MLRIGLTGNIGSGKSICSKIFMLLGVPVYNADIEAKKLYSNPVFKNKVITNFGNDILTFDEIDKAKLAALVFNDKLALDKLNKIIHPEVLNNFNSWTNAQDNEVPYVVQEAAIIFESKIEKYFDKIIVVTCPADVRINRIIKRDGLTEEEIMNRMKNQISEEEKATKADFLIHNNDKDLLIPQILEIHSALISIK